MNRILTKITGMALFLTVMLPELALAAAEKAAPLVLVADTRKLTGLMRWWADLYNESHVWFTVLTVVLIPLIGLAFGVIADIVMSHIGIDLKSRDLAEH
jgi:hypothetical protein